MYSAKGMKDIVLDRKEFSNSINNLKFGNYQLFRSQLNAFYSQILLVFLSEKRDACFESLSKLLEETKTDYEVRINNSYKDAGKNILKEEDVSTLFNVNRELYSSCKALVFSLKDYLLDTENAEKFENVPVSVIK